MEVIAVVHAVKILAIQLERRPQNVILAALMIGAWFAWHEVWRPTLFDEFGDALAVLQLSSASPHRERHVSIEFGVRIDADR